MSDIDTGVVVSLKVLDPDGRLEKRTSSAAAGMSALRRSRPNAPQQKAVFDHRVGGTNFQRIAMLVTRLCGVFSAGCGSGPS